MIIVNIFLLSDFSKTEYIILRRIVKILCFHSFGILETHTQSVKFFITSLANLYSSDVWIWLILGSFLEITKSKSKRHQLDDLGVLVSSIYLSRFINEQPLDIRGGGGRTGYNKRSLLFGFARLLFKWPMQTTKSWAGMAMMDMDSMRNILIEMWDTFIYMIIMWKYVLLNEDIVPTYLDVWRFYFILATSLKINHSVACLWTA